MVNRSQRLYGNSDDGAGGARVSRGKRRRVGWGLAGVCRTQLSGIQQKSVLSKGEH
jgi:hypothetical protein